MRPVIDLQGVSVLRSGVTVLDKVTWRVEGEQHWAVLGPNGSGKTSLLNVLAGYVAPGEGAVEVLGRQPGGDGWDTVRDKIGLVSSSMLVRIDPGQTALDTVISGKYTSKWSLWRKLFANDKARAYRVMRLTECRDLAKRKWGVLSQGEKQRVLIARALMLRPRLLILDEPCAGLDILSREKFLRFLRHFGYQKGAPTLLMATHHAEEISSIFKHVLLLRKGGVSAAGGIDDTLSSDNVSKAFGSLLRIERRDNAFRITRARRS